jgi:hypothetical protein
LLTCEVCNDPSALLRERWPKGPWGNTWNIWVKNLEFLLWFSPSQAPIHDLQWPIRILGSRAKLLLMLSIFLYYHFYCWSHYEAKTKKRRKKKERNKKFNMTFSKKFATCNIYKSS